MRPPWRPRPSSTRKPPGHDRAGRKDDAMGRRRHRPGHPPALGRLLTKQLGTPGELVLVDLSAGEALGENTSSLTVWSGWRLPAAPENQPDDQADESTEDDQPKQAAEPHPAPAVHMVIWVIVLCADRCGVSDGHHRRAPSSVIPVAELRHRFTRRTTTAGSAAIAKAA